MNISVITPSFNQGCFIEKTIDSVLSQNYANFNYLICDGGSTDQTLSILEKYQKKHPRLSYISEPDHGQAHAVNKGILATEGDIIAWINSDDLYVPKTFETVVNIFINYPQALVIYGQAHHIDETDHFLNTYPVEPWNYHRLQQTCFLCQPAVFFRRVVVEQFGLLDESFHYTMDYEYWLRCGKKIEFFYIPQVLAASRLYSTNKTLSNRDQVFYESSLAVRIHNNKVPDRWIIGHAFVMSATKLAIETEITLEDKQESRLYDRVFFKEFLKASVQNYQFWKQWPSPWGISKLLYWFFQCYYWL